MFEVGTATQGHECFIFLNMKHITVPIQLLAYLLNAIYILILKYTRLHTIIVVINTDSI